MMWPPPAIADPSPPAVKPKAELAPPPPPNYFNIQLKDSLMYTAGLSTTLGN